MRQLVSRRGLRPFPVDVPACAPETREQWAEWCRHWPVAWRVPEQGPGEAAGGSGVLLTAAEQAYFEQQMAAALRIAAAGEGAPAVADTSLEMDGLEERAPTADFAGLATDATRADGETLHCSRYCGGNAAIIVDPVTGEVVGSSETDGIRGSAGGSSGPEAVHPGRIAVRPIREAVNRPHRHPLAHATMRAIEAAAERDRQRWPLLDPLQPAGPRANLDPPADLDPSLSGSRSAQLPRPPLMESEGPASEGTADGGRSDISLGGNTSSDGRRPSMQSHAAADGKVGGPADADVESQPPDGVESQPPEQPAGKRPRLSNRSDGITDSGDGPAAKGGGTGDTSDLGNGAASLSISAARPYMCTGYDAFLVQEPCIMCAMVRGGPAVQVVAAVATVRRRANKGTTDCSISGAFHNIPQFQRIIAGRRAPHRSLTVVRACRSLLTLPMHPHDPPSPGSCPMCTCGVLPSPCPRSLEPHPLDPPCMHAGPGTCPGGPRGVLPA